MHGENIPETESLPHPRSVPRNGSSDLPQPQPLLHPDGTATHVRVTLLHVLRFWVICWSFSVTQKNFRLSSNHFIGEVGTQSMKRVTRWLCRAEADCKMAITLDPGDMIVRSLVALS